MTYPLKSSIWLTHKRVFYICWCTIIILLLANLSFINLSGIRISRNRRKYCGLDENSIIVDLLTASILPMGMCLSILSMLMKINKYLSKYGIADKKKKRLYLFFSREVDNPINDMAQWNSFAYDTFTQKNGENSILFLMIGFHPKSIVNCNYWIYIALFYISTEVIRMIVS